MRYIKTYEAWIEEANSDLGMGNKYSRGGADVLRSDNAKGNIIEEPKPEEEGEDEYEEYKKKMYQAASVGESNEGLMTNKLSDEEKKTAHNNLAKLAVSKGLYSDKDISLTDPFPRGLDFGNMVLIVGTPKRKAKKMEIDLDILNVNQPSVPYEGIKAYIDNPPEELPEVIKYEGNYYIQSGNTRVSVLKLAGRNKIFVNFYELKD